VHGPLTALRLDRSPSAAPLYRQIRDGVRGAVLSGALGAGSRLPPERELAQALAVNRSTIMRAYQDLAADGIVEARPGRGTVIAPRTGGSPSPYAGEADAHPAWLVGLPAFGNSMLGPDPGLLREITTGHGGQEIVSFAAGAPGTDLIPLDALRDAFDGALLAAGPEGLGYGPVEGQPALRHLLAEHLATRGLATTPPQVLIVAGATQGLSLVARALVEPGDEVVVESPTYVGIIQTFAASGARLIGVPVDERGLRTEALAAILSRRTVRLLVVQPSFHNPTTVQMAQERREQLLSLAVRYGVPILEDDPYGEIWHQAPGLPPLKSLDRSGSVIYLGTFSKTLAPGLRLGWLVAAPAVINRLALAKQFADLLSNTPAQFAVAQLLRSGGYTAHLAAIRPCYAQRRAAMLAGLRSAAGLEVLPGFAGGFYLWCRLPAGRPARVLAAAARRHGVSMLPGEAFYPRVSVNAPDGERHVRLSFSFHPPAVIAEGTRRLAELLCTDTSLIEPEPGGVLPVI
jgi:DNA-binding transcriptional MocR family regulator